jgi:hypothetical protein
VHGDVGATLRAVLPLISQKTDRSSLDRMLRRHEKALSHVVDAYTHDIESHVPIHPRVRGADPRRGHGRQRGAHRGHRYVQLWAARLGRATPNSTRSRRARVLMSRPPTGLLTNVRPNNTRILSLPAPTPQRSAGPLETIA